MNAGRTGCTISDAAYQVADGESNTAQSRDDGDIV